MTEWFEVLERDGAARLGELRLAESVSTPALVDGPGHEPDLIADAGSLWPAERPDPEARDDQLTLLPHRSLPGGTPDAVRDAFAPDQASVDFPSAVVIPPDTVSPFNADAAVLSGAQQLDGHAAAFVQAIIEVRETIPPDTALYLPGIASPRNLATLVYAGVDLVDTDRAVVRATQGRYLTAEGEYRLADLDELPCACPACQVPIAEFSRESCERHNVNALRAALGTVRTRLREGRLRDYLEGQARFESWCTATLRRFDDQWNYLEARTPIARRAEILAATEDTLRRVEIRRFAERVTSRYRCRFDAPLVLVPCSARKPYSESQSHGQFRDAINYRGHIASMTSPIGVVPQELELTYPAQHYDAIVTGRWSAEEIDVVARTLERYLERAEYPRVVAHVPEEGYRDICERVEATIDIPFEYTVGEHPTTDASLANLDEALANEPQYARHERQDHTVRGIADYQFGDGAGDELFEEIEITGRYPKYQVRDEGGEQLAAVVPEYGLLAFTLAGASRWVDSGAPTLTVTIDRFVPHGSVLAPGVVEADESIRVGDEVLVRGPAAFGVGRAVMSGPEMAASTRGVAVDVRHVEET